VRALHLVAAKGDPHAISELIGLLEHTDHGVTNVALCGLAEFAEEGNNDAVVATSRCLRGTDEDSKLFLHAIAALALARVAEKGDMPAITLVTKLLDEADWRLRREAIWALVKLSPAGDKSALSAVGKLANDADERVRLEAAQALTELKRPSGGYTNGDSLPSAAVALNTEVKNGA